MCFKLCLQRRKEVNRENRKMKELPEKRLKFLGFLSTPHCFKFEIKHQEILRYSWL
jgi:hypothetical protein